MSTLDMDKRFSGNAYGSLPPGYIPPATAYAQPMPGVYQTQAPVAMPVYTAPYGSVPAGGMPMAVTYLPMPGYACGDEGRATPMIMVGLPPEQQAQLQARAINMAQFTGLIQPINPAAYGGAQPPTNTDPANQIKYGEWEVGLFDCFQHCVPNAFMSFVCPCVSIAQIYSRVGYGVYKGIIGQLVVTLVFPVMSRVAFEIMFRHFRFDDEGPPFAVNFILIFPIFVYASHVVGLRWRMRARFKIPGGCLYDFIAGVFCFPCSIAQMATHVKSYKPGQCSFDPPDMLPPFV